MSTNAGEPRRLGLKLVVQAQPCLFTETLVGALTAIGHVVRGATTEAGTVPGLVSVATPELCILHDVEPVSCLHAARAVREQAAAVRLLVLSTGKTPQTARAYDEHIIDAVVGQACAFSRLGFVLHRVAAGERVLALGAPQAADSLAAPALTLRERQVLELLARGESTQVIADELAISPHTVRSHVQGLTRKLGAHGRGRAVRTALSRNLLESRVT